MEGEAVREHLSTFDAYTWSECCCRGGQIGIAFASQESQNRSQILEMIVNKENQFPSEGTHCIRIEGNCCTSVLMRVRGRIHRMSQTEAIKRARHMNNVFKAAKENRDPFCHTSQQELFGPYSSVLRSKYPDEECNECISATAVPYQTTLERFEVPVEWYAPLCFLVMRGVNRPYALAGVVPVLTDPRKINLLVANWERAGASISPFDLNILANDFEFMAFLDLHQTLEQRVIADPIFDGNQSLVSGVQFKVVDKLEVAFED